MRRIEPQDVAEMWLHITWAGGEAGPVEMFENAPDSYEIVVFGLPVDLPCHLSIQALDSDGLLIYSGDVSGVVFSGDEVLDVTVNLTAADSGAAAGTAPHVDSIMRPADDIPAGMIIDLVFVASDPDDDELQYLLESSGDGSFDAPSGTIPLSNGVGMKGVRFTTPSQPGTAEVTLTLTDAAGLQAVFTFTLTLVEPPQELLPGAGHVMSNFPPLVRAISVTQLPADNEIALLADVTDDGGLDGLTYAWEVDGVPYATGNPMTYPRDAGAIAVILTVADAQGASTSLQFDIDTAATGLQDIPLGNLPPLITGAVISRSEASYGDTVTCAVYAEDPDSDPLQAQWATDHGAIGATSVVIQGQTRIFRAEWQADVDPGTAAVVVTITDDDLATATYTFTINQILGMVGVHADAGEDQEAFVSGAALLDGSGSYSDDGVIEGYLWEQISGPGSTIVSPADPQTEVLVTSIGTYVYRLTVWNVNNEDSATVEVLVIDPAQFAYDDADIDQNGMIYFLDTTTDRVRRYDTVAETFRPSFATSTGLYRFAVAPEGDQIYVGYEGGRMDVIDAATGSREFFAAAASTVLRMAVIEGYIFTIDASGSWETHSLYSRATGTQTFADGWRNNSNGVAYARSLARIFTFRDGSSPNDIIRTDVNLAEGTLGPDIDSPYHGDYTFTHPMRLFPDESRIAVASGVYFDTADLTYAGSIGMSYKDLRFFGDRAYIIRQIGSQTELTEMDLEFNVLGSTTYSGTPLNLFASADKLFLITAPEAGRVEIQKVAELEQ